MRHNVLEATYALGRGVMPFIGFAHSDVSDRPWPWLLCKESLWKSRIFLLFWRRRTLLPWQLPVQWFWQIGIPSTIMQKANASRKGISKKLSCCESILKVIFSIFHCHTSFHAEGREEKRIIDFLLLILNQVSHDRRWLLFKHTRSANAGIDLLINWRLLQ